MMRPAMHLRRLLADGEVIQDENWMVSYIDVFVLMTTLFVLLLVLQKRELGTGEVRTGKAPTMEEIITDLNALPAPAAGVESEIDDKDPDAISVSDRLAQSLIDFDLQNHVVLQPDDRQTALEIDSNVLFNSGEAELTRAGIAVLEKLLPVLQMAEGRFVIEGHTDDQPIGTAKYPSNWELGAARATEVLQFFVIEGMDETRVRAVSYGATQPRVPNDSASNRRKNRRVNLIIENG